MRLPALPSLPCPCAEQFAQEASLALEQWRAAATDAALLALAEHAWEQSEPRVAAALAALAMLTDAPAGALDAPAGGDGVGDGQLGTLAAHMRRREGEVRAALLEGGAARDGAAAAWRCVRGVEAALEAALAQLAAGRTG